MNRDILIKHKYTIILMLIILSSSVFIFGGANWGLPLPLHIDEQTIVRPAINMVRNRTFEPEVFFRPDHLLIQINSLFYHVIVFAHGEYAENINNISTEVFYLTARIVTGVFAVGSIVLSYLIGRKYSKFVAVTCAFLFAFFPIYIKHSHYATPDIPTVFFMLVFINIALNYMQKPDIKNLVFMTLVTAAFITIKYPGALLCLMIAISVIVSSIIEKRYIRIFDYGLSAVLLVPIFIFLISPALILKLDEVRNALSHETRSAQVGADGLSPIGNMLFYVNNYLSASGIILFVFFVIGCYVILSQKQSVLKNIPIFYSLIFWVCLSFLQLHWERWGLPMYVSPLLISAIGINWVYDMIKTHKRFQNRQKLYICAFTVVLSISAINIISTSYGNLLSFILPDTRIVSLEYVKENNINKNNSVYDGFTTLNTTYFRSMREPFEKIDDVYYLKNHRIENILLSSYVYDMFKAEPERYASTIQFYNSIKENFIETKRFDVVPRYTSMLEPVNIFHNICYIIRAKNHGMVGPTLIFLKAGSENYAP